MGPCFFIKSLHYLDQWRFGDSNLGLGLSILGLNHAGGLDDVWVFGLSYEGYNIALPGIFLRCLEEHCRSQTHFQEIVVHFSKHSRKIFLPNKMANLTWPMGPPARHLPRIHCCSFVV